MYVDEAIKQVSIELSKATGAFGAFHTIHEGLAVILEEYEELKAEVFKKAELRDIGKLRHEAKQVAAMGIRFMVDLT